MRRCAADKLSMTTSPNGPGIPVAVDDAGVALASDAPSAERSTIRRQARNPPVPEIARSSTGALVGTCAQRILRMTKDPWPP